MSYYSPIAMEDFDKIKSQSKFSIIGHMTQESEGFILLPEQILISKSVVGML
jgi:hypothetical protein